MSRPLSAAMEQTIVSLHGLPSTHRVQGIAGGTLKLAALEVVDGRTLTALVHRGLIAFNEHGAIITEAGRDAAEAVLAQRRTRQRQRRPRRLGRTAITEQVRHA